MSQHDLTIDDQGFPSFRSDLNSALQALGSTNSGTSAPSTTFANQLFYDTTNNILKIRNEDNDAFISLFTLDQTNDNIESLTIDGTLNVNGGVIFNENSADVDFRVESNDSANMLFLNGGNNQVGIGIDPSSTVFHVETSTDGSGVSGDNIYIAKFYNKEATDSRSFGLDIHAGSTSSDQALRCKTHDGGTELFVVKGDGSVTVGNGLTLTDGNVTVASGHGIDFSATSDATGMTGELLDNYEVGTYTPTVTGRTSGSYTIGDSATKLSYVRIGMMVHLQGQIHITGESSPSGVVDVSLPFASGNGSDLSDRSVGSVAFDGAGANGPAHNSGNFVNFMVSSNASVGTFRSSEDNASAGSLNQSHITTNDRFVIGITYMTFA